MRGGHAIREEENDLLAKDLQWMLSFLPFCHLHLHLREGERLYLAGDLRSFAPRTQANKTSTNSLIVNQPASHYLLSDNDRT